MPLSLAPSLSLWHWFIEETSTCRVQKDPSFVWLLPCGRVYVINGFLKNLKIWMPNGVKLNIFWLKYITDGALNLTLHHMKWQVINGWPNLSNTKITQGVWMKSNPLTVQVGFPPCIYKLICVLLVCPLQISNTPNYSVVLTWIKLSFHERIE